MGITNEQQVNKRREHLFIRYCFFLVFMFYSCLATDLAYGLENPAVKVKTTLSQMDAYYQKQKNWDAFTVFYFSKRGNAAKLADLENAYYQNLQSYQGKYTKATDVAKLILSGNGCGQNPYFIQQQNLVAVLTNWKNIEAQGVNGPIFALLAYDNSGLRLPADRKNNRPALIKMILSYQNEDGGFGLGKISASSVDITAMALTALAPYQKEAAVSSAIRRGMVYLQKQQQENGAFAQDNHSAVSCESTAQVMIALSALGVDSNGSQFQKKNGSALDGLYLFSTGQQGFSHQIGGESNELATQQGSLALVAYQQYLQKQPTLYKNTWQVGNCRDEKIISSWAKEAVHAFCQQGIVSGDGEGYFHPQQMLTRAEGAKLALLWLALEIPKQKQSFVDVSSAAWYAPYVENACQYGLLQGIGKKQFMPQARLTREDFAVMVWRGIGSPVVNTTPRFLFQDGETVHDYAQQAVAFLGAEGYMQGQNGYFLPQQAINREMAVTILYRIYQDFFV